MTAIEEFLDLDGNRLLAYAHKGNPSSNDVIVFFHGVFGIGRVSPALFEKDVHYLAPTLPGWGNSSPPPPSMTFHDYLYEVITVLVTHFHPVTKNIRLYVTGAFYGTVAAQMLYGASYDDFPLGKQIAGLMLVCPLSPPHIHKDYAKCLSWGSYITLGPPSRYLPTMKFSQLTIQDQVTSPEKATAFIHGSVQHKMSSEEREAFQRTKEMRNLSEGEAEAKIGQMMYLSVANTWEGYLAVPKVYHSGWGGYDPTSLDDEHATKPVLLVLVREHEENMLMGEWLLKHMRNVHGRYEGSVMPTEDIWADFLEKCSTAVYSGVPTGRRDLPSPMSSHDCHSHAA
ncbi:hypothetical protein QCA50_008079 [Cerrena zonata]|uniref:AB hydrolase-1 domain-containing protein n=1 Tax=Cerrena zonata TaxID=2478898 RepID=A0AAW0G732_9APHY